MKTINENLTLADFDAWSGAKDTKETILNANKGDEFDSLIEDLYPDGLTDTALNDILWFENDWLMEQLGISEEDNEEEEETEE
ncbi:MAG: hypothetical protein JJE45_00235 [Prolixibacteraceae bacterium]|nr:hypothetical protein [Prolixibacteraceae bacterium]